MKTKYSALCALAAMALIVVLTGCDWVRGTLGMPTSSEIEAKQQLIAQKEAKEKAQKDSIAKVEAAEKAVKDSLAKLPQQRKLKEIQNKYLIVVGTYLMQKNVDRCIAKYSNVLDKPYTVKRWDDMIMVVVGEGATWEEANGKLASVKSQCPEAWIYVKKN